MQLHFEPEYDRSMSQWMTPLWSSTLLVERYFPDLDSSSLVLEPTCGIGRFLQAIPDDVPAIGVELDERLAAEAERRTGRRIIHGDFRTVELPEGITDIIGNPPFKVSFIRSLLGRARHILPDTRRCGLLLPAYSLQTHNTVAHWLQNWSMSLDLVPRNLFPRSRLPLCFALFTRSKSRDMIGMAMYREAVEYDRMGDVAKEVLTDGKPNRGVWRALVETILEQLGGEATLAEIYRAIEPKRPTPNAFWQEKVRQELQRNFVSVERGRWRLK